MREIKPTEQQQKFLDCKSDINILITGIGWGMTTTLCKKALDYAKKNPESNIILVEPIEQMVVSSMIPAFKTICAKDYFDDNYSAPCRKLRLLNGSDIYFVSSERIEKHRCSNINFLGIDNARDIRNHRILDTIIRNQLSDNGKLVIATTWTIEPPTEDYIVWLEWAIEHPILAWISHEFRKSPTHTEFEWKNKSVTIMDELPGCKEYLQTEYYNRLKQSYVDKEIELKGKWPVGE